jgi:hypothetical protein
LTKGIAGRRVQSSVVDVKRLGDAEQSFITDLVVEHRARRDALCTHQVALQERGQPCDWLARCLLDNQDDQITTSAPPGGFAAWEADSSSRNDSVFLIIGIQSGLYWAEEYAEVMILTSIDQLRSG